MTDYRLVAETARRGSVITTTADEVDGVPSQLGISTQPSGAVTGVEFTGQPVVQIRDSNEAVVTDATNTVTAAIGSGSGSLSGDTTKDAVDGIATFTDLAITGSGAHTLTFTSPGLTSVTSSSFTLGGGGGGDQWTPVSNGQIDFGTETGTGENALTDGDRFDALTGDSDDAAEVIAAPGGEGWLTTNVCKVHSTNASGRNGYIEMRKEGLGEIGDGEIRNYRFAFLSNHPTAAEGATDNSHHGIQDGIPSGGGGNQNWGFNDDTNYVGEWVPTVKINSGVAGPDGDRFYIGSTVSPTRLTKGVKYTFDIQIIAASSTTFRIKCWVYNSAGTEIHGPTDWKSSNHSGETMTTGRGYTYQKKSSTDAVAFGLNGTNHSSWTPDGDDVHHSTQGEIAIVTSVSDTDLTEGTSIEPYGSVEGES